MRVPVRGLVLVAVAVVAVASLTPATSRSGGIFGRAREGCGGTGCHVGGPADVQIAFGGPGNWTPGTTYNVTVSISGSLPEAPTAQNRGGFNLLVSDGNLSAPNGSEAVKIRQEGNTSGREATHTSAGNDQRSWVLLWHAPTNGTGEVTVWVAANAVNGNGQADIGDEWSTMKTTIPYSGNGSEGNASTEEPIPEQPENVPGPGPVAIGAALAVTAVAVRAAASRDRS